MVQGASDARDGRPVGGWLHPTNRVTVTYLGESTPEIVKALDGCLIYLGHADNVTVLPQCDERRRGPAADRDLLVVALVEQKADMSSASDKSRATPTWGLGLRGSRPRIACEPTTINSDCWMIWLAVRIACSS